MSTIPILESTPMLKEASLLGLPRELRLNIYEAVFALDLDYVVLSQWRDTHSAEHGFKSVPDLNEEEKLVIPWLELMLTCKAVAIELRALMSEPSFPDDPMHSTFVLDLEASRGGMTLGPTKWRRLPCAPNKTRYVEARYNASRGIQAWGVGGPHGITSGLYQTLNHLVHCGPRFDSTRPLKQPMHISKLRVIVEKRDPEDAEQDEHAHYRLSERETDPETTLYALGSIVGQINRTGVLRGFVDQIRLRSGDKVLRWAPEETHGGGIPEYWNRYGFDWGLELYQKK